MIDHDIHFKSYQEYQQFHDAIEALVQKKELERIDWPSWYPLNNLDVFGSGNGVLYRLKRSGDVFLIFCGDHQSRWFWIKVR